MDKDIEQQRSRWLKAVKRIVETCLKREAQLADICPQRTHLDKGTKWTALKSIAILSRDISAQVKRLAALETDGGVGFVNVLGHCPDELTAVVLSLLVAARLDSAAASQFRVLSDVMNAAAVRDPIVALQVRNMFRGRSELAPLVVLGRGIAADECFVTLRESVFNKILNQSQDALEARCEAEALLGKAR